MFILSRLEDTVRVLPTDFRKNPTDAITDCINLKFSNKVLHDVGLGIKVHEIIKMSDLIVHQCQDGSYQSTVEFLLVVFRPLKVYIKLT
jgi:DNA-directed RNA polymerase III subunit RPC8